jgi:hypothetical protein
VINLGQEHSFSSATDNANALALHTDEVQAADREEASMTSGFNLHEAAGYEELMGRWSQKLAPLFIDFAGVAIGEKILDVGCGTGSLTLCARTRRLPRRDRP